MPLIIIAFFIFFCYLKGDEEMRQMYLFRVLFTLALVSVFSVSCKKNPVEQNEAVAPMEGWGVRGSFDAQR